MIGTYVDPRNNVSVFIEIVLLQANITKADIKGLAKQLSVPGQRVCVFKSIENLNTFPYADNYEIYLELVSNDTVCNKYCFVEKRLCPSQTTSTPFFYL